MDGMHHKLPGLDDYHESVSGDIPVILHHYAHEPLEEIKSKRYGK